MSRPASVEEARRPAGGAAAADVASREYELILGSGGGDVEQAPLLLEVLRVGALQRAPGGQQLFLTAEQHHEFRLGALGAVDGRDGDPTVLAGSDLFGMQSGGVLEEAGERCRRTELVREGLGGSAERAQVLEHALAIAASHRRAVSDRGASRGERRAHRRA